MVILAQNLPLTSTQLERFLKHFPCRYNLITKILDSEYEHGWLTSYKVLTIEKLIELWESRGIAVGVGFNSLTEYFMVDIDRGSLWHYLNSRRKHNELLWCLEEIGLNKPVIVQSSDSEGIHIYYRLSKSVSSFYLAFAVKSHLIKNGFNVAPGQIELFPNTKVFGSIFNRHRLPLQNDSFIFNDDMEGFSDSVEVWCDLMDESAIENDIALICETIEFYKNQPKPKKERVERIFGISPKAKIWIENINNLIKRGWTGDAQTNDILKDLCGYGMVFEKLSGEALIDWLVKTVKSCPGYEIFCGHQEDIRSRCKEWFLCNKKNEHWKPYRGNPDRLLNPNTPRVNKNDVKAEESKTRLETVIECFKGIVFKSQNQLYKAVIAKSKELFKVGFSNDTLAKYKNLWKSLIEKNITTEESIADDVPISVEKEPEIEIPETVDTSGLEGVTHPMPIKVGNLSVLTLNPTDKPKPQSQPAQKTIKQTSEIDLPDKNINQNNPLIALALAFSRFKLFNIWKL